MRRISLKEAEMFSRVFWYQLAHNEDDAVIGGVSVLGGNIEVPLISEDGSRRAILRLCKVTPCSNFVRPTIGGSPFLTNSHKPGNLCPASLNASRACFSCRSPLSSKTILLTGILDAQ